VIKLKNFSHNILNNISFELQHNQNLIILGSNGAGKSTLAKVLCGIIPSPILIEGEPLKYHTNRKKLINYIPPKMEIFDEYLTLEEYLELSKINTLLEVKNSLKLLEIEHLKSKPCKQLSSGEQQLTMLATALLHNAKVTIFDEPTANLDPQKSKNIFSILKSKLFHQKIIITHDLNLAYRLGYNILYMKEGKIDFYDCSKSFFEEYNLHKYFGNSVKKVDNFIMVNL